MLVWVVFFVCFNMIQNKKSKKYCLKIYKNKNIQKNSFKRIVKKFSLKLRDPKLNSLVNFKHIMLKTNSKVNFNCDICKRLLKDSLNYMLHINGKWHMKMLGLKKISS